MSPPFKLFNSPPSARRPVQVALGVVLVIALVLVYALVGRVFFLSLILIALVFLASSVKMADQYDTVVILRLGKKQKVKKGGGLYLLVPIMDQALIVNNRTQTIDPPRQEMITSDNVTITVDAVVLYRVVDAEKAVFEVTDYETATRQAVVSVLRGVVGQSELKTFLTEPTKIAEAIRIALASHTQPWGIDVLDVGITDVEFEQALKGAFGRKAEAVVEAEAKFVAAQAENRAAPQLVKAAEQISTQPNAMQLRYLQTMTEISAQDQTSTVIVPLPIDMLRAMLPAAPKPDEPTA